ncbi:hypothetical protein D3C81_1955110 [compost metagenome]
MSGLSSLYLPIVRVIVEPASTELPSFTLESITFPSLFLSVVSLSLESPFNPTALRAFIASCFDKPNSFGTFTGFFP